MKMKRCMNKGSFFFCFCCLVVDDACAVFPPTWSPLLFKLFAKHLQRALEMPEPPCSKQWSAAIWSPCSFSSIVPSAAGRHVFVWKHHITLENVWSYTWFAFSWYNLFVLYLCGRHWPRLKMHKNTAVFCWVHVLFFIETSMIQLWMLHHHCIWLKTESTCLPINFWRRAAFEAKLGQKQTNTMF